MRLRKLIVLGALALFVGGMSSCSKKSDNANMDSTTTAPAAPAPTPAPPPPPADTSKKMDTMMKQMPAGGDMKKDMKK
jgi:hypothetical protein